ncbi:lysozyme inhibitor LprI family protein [Pantoea agglomerans]
MKIYMYILPLPILFCNLSIAQEVTCSSPDVLVSLNANLHNSALIRNTKLLPKTILTVPVNFSEISDSVARDGWLSCWAYASIEIDKNIGKLLTSEDFKYSKSATETATNYLGNIKITHANESNDMLVMNSLQYSVYVNTEGTLKKVEIDANDPLTYAIYGVAWFQQNIDRVKSEVTQNAYIDAYNNFIMEDRNINDIYNGFPVIIQERLRSDMRKWIKEKNDKCGKVESLSKKITTTNEKTKVYKCQIEMTQKQIKILTR